MRCKLSENFKFHNIYFKIVWVFGGWLGTIARQKWNFSKSSCWWCVVAYTFICIYIYICTFLEERNKHSEMKKSTCTGQTGKFGPKVALLKAHSKVWDIFWHPKGLLKRWKMLLISPWKLFSFWRYLNFCLAFLVICGHGLI